MDVDVAVLGGGPGGYPAAIRACQLGLSVAVIEQGRLGGTCLNVGCIPTKAWVQSAHAVKDSHSTFRQLGVNVGEVEIDWPQVQTNKQAIVDGLVSGVGGLLKANGATVVNGRGRFAGPHTIITDTGETVNFKSAVIATGSFPVRPPIEGIDHPKCVDSTGLLEVQAIPKRLVVIGGGVIGCEFASIFSHFGSEVTIVEFLDHLISTEDQDAVAALERAFRKEKITLHLSAKGTKVEETADGMTLHFEKAGEQQSVSGDLILVATGRAAIVDDMGLDMLGVEFDRTGIRTDGHRRTKIPHIYAVGDVAGYWQLAHTAFREGEVAAENIAGHDVVMEGAVPRCVYTDPEIGAVGLTEAQARDRGLTVHTGLSEVPRSARGWIHKAGNEGFIKLVVDADRGVLVGATSAGPVGGEVLSALAVAVHAEVPVDRLRTMIYAYPTFHRGIQDALSTLP
jgi:dihydrolipoamide dehydrogenase